MRLHLAFAILVGLLCRPYDGYHRTKAGWTCAGVADQCVITSPTTTFIMQPRSFLRYIELDEFGNGRRVRVKCL